MNFGKLLSNISPIPSFLLGIADTIRADQNAQRLNKMAEQGREKLDRTGQTLLEKQLGNADKRIGQVKANNERAYARNMDTMGHWASSMFGAPIPQQEGGIRPSDVKQMMAGMKPGEGSLSTAIRGQGDEFLRQLDTELGGTLSSIIESTDSKLSDHKKWIQTQIDQARTDRTAALDMIDDDTAYTVASTTASMQADKEIALAQLSQRYADAEGDPQKMAKYHREKQLVEQKFRNEANKVVVETEGLMSKMKADTYTNLTGHVTAMTGTLGASLGNLTSDMAKLQTGARTEMAMIKSNAMGNVFSAVANATGQEAEMQNQWYGTMMALEDTYKADQNAAEMDLASMVSGSWENWAQMGVAHAQSLINASMEMVSYAKPVQDLFNMGTSLWQSQLAQQSADNYAKAVDNQNLTNWASIGTNTALGMERNWLLA
jgi:hypothetical protein